MSVIAESIREKTALADDKENQDLILCILDNLPPTVIIEEDGPLADILPHEAIDRWNAKVREDLKKGGIIERKERPRHVNLTDERPIFLDGDEPMDVPLHINRWVKTR